MEGEGKEEEVVVEEDTNGGINGKDGGDDAAGTATKPEEEEDEYFKAYFDLEVRTDLGPLYFPWSPICSSCLGNSCRAQ